MAEDPLIGAFIPQDWLEEIDAICTQQGHTRSEWLASLIAEVLGKTNGHTLIALRQRVDRLEQNQEEMGALQRQIAALKQEVQSLQMQLHSVSLQARSGQPNEPQRPLVQPSESYDFPETEDEPDEILYDFLEPRRSVE
jgi:hypothetical protein